jgi:hypothetical protein
MTVVETHPTAVCCWCGSGLVKAKHWWCPRAECRTKQRESGIGVQKGKSVDWWFVPLPSQAQFELVKAPRKLWGGAAGGGKSVAARRLAIKRCLKIAGYAVLLLRRSFPELERTHIRALRREAAELGLFSWAEARRTAEFPNGSTLECGHMEDEAAVQRYLSSEYDLIIGEEGVQFAPDALMEVMSRARTSNPEVVALGGAEVWIPTNPGGPSHALLSDLFIEKTPDVERYPAMARTYKPEQWAFLPSKLDDNPYLDPEYETLALSGLRKARYEQLRHGDWNAAEGQFFEMFSARTHARVLRPFEGAEWIEAFDWGYNQPSCWGAFWHVGDNHWHCQKALKFRKLEPEDAAAVIVEARRELGYQTPERAVADPKIFSEDRGESIAETMRRHGVSFIRAINKRTDSNSNRQMGWPRLASWFRFDPATATTFGPHGQPLDGVPWLTFDPTQCQYLLRSIPALLADPNDPDDVDTSLDDHGADMCRYFVMSRPAIGVKAAPEDLYPINSHAWWNRHYYEPAHDGVLA